MIFAATQDIPIGKELLFDYGKEFFAINSSDDGVLSSARNEKNGY